MPGIVECEFEREGRKVVLSVRSGRTNFVLTLPLDGATVFAATAQRATADEETEARYRFSINNAGLEVST
jgi:hypothetical protein